MTALTTGLLTGLGAAVGFGFGDFFAARSSRQYSPVHAIFWSQALKLPIFGIIFGVLGWHLVITPRGVVLAICTAVILVIGQLAAFQAFKLGPVSLASPFVSGYALITAALSLLFLREHLRPLQLMAIVLLVSGAMLASISSDTHRPQKHFWKQPTVFLALTGALGIGVSLFFLALLVHELGWQSSIVTQSVFVLLSSGLFDICTKRSLLTGNHWPLSRNIVGGVIFGGIFGTIMINFGFSSALAAIVAPVASISPLITVSLALYFFKERLSRYQLGGALVVISALALLSVR